MFSALVSKPIKKKDQDKIDFNLDIPDLPQDRNFIKWQIPNTSNYEWIDYKNLMQNNNYLKVKTDRSCSPTSNTSSNNQMIDDEGFCSDKCSPIINSSRSKLQDSNNLWDNALKYTISEYIDWDMRAQHSLYISGLTENDRFKKKLLIDSDSFVFDQFYYHYLTTINILVDKPLDIKNQRILIKQSQYITDSLNVLISLSSFSYIWRDDYFEFNECLQISGMSSESLASYSKEYALTGTYHRYLINFIQIPERNVDCGSVFRSFVNGIKTYLRYYNEQIISKLKETENLTLVSLNSHFKLIMDQIKLVKFLLF